MGSSVYKVYLGKLSKDYVNSYGRWHQKQVYRRPVTLRISYIKQMSCVTNYMHSLTQYYRVFDLTPKAKDFLLGRTLMSCVKARRQIDSFSQHETHVNAPHALAQFRAKWRTKRQAGRRKRAQRYFMAFYFESIMLK